METTKNDLVKATQEGYENALVDLNDKAWLRSVISTLPYIGSIINELLASKAGEITAKRISFFHKEIKEHLETLEESKINLDFFESEEFYDIYTKALQAAIATRHDEKIRAYAEILVGAGLKKATDHDSELYLNIMADLQPVELQVARALYELQIDGPEPGKNVHDWEREGHSWKNLSETLEMEEPYLKLILQRLLGVGLVTEPIYVETMLNQGHFVVSTLLRNLMLFLQETRNNY